MANNRMYLCNPATGKRVMLAKHFGGVWETRDTELSETLDEVFATDGHASCEWRIEYECAPGVYQAFPGAVSLRISTGTLSPCRPENAPLPIENDWEAKPWET